MRPGTLLLVSFVDLLCTHYACSVTSWWRSARHNREKGGQADSRHVYGEAIDVVWDTEPMPLVLLQSMATPFCVRVVREKDHDHFQSTLPKPGVVVAGGALNT